ncbi:GNAT family N-acetyltransferase [Candidatus Parcubacteria bacterium]|nr:MAG: GNAT family N-acetyltransferase [Candidatus Parcubacteria bacterium]
MMEKIRRLITEMKETGKYHEARLDPRKFARLHKKGLMLFEFDRTQEPWRIIGVVGLWETDVPYFVEIGTFYVSPEFWKNGIGRKLFSRIVQIASQDSQLFTVMSDERAMRIAMTSGFVPVTLATLGFTLTLMKSLLGPDRVIPDSVYPYCSANGCTNYGKAKPGERWMFMKINKGE